VATVINRHVDPHDADLVDRLLETMHAPGRRYWMVIAVLLAVIALGGVSYWFQVRDGLLVTGMRDRIFWGLYIGTFEFFLGVGMAGTFLSAVLRLTGAGWRMPVTRLAEIMAVSALVAALLLILLDIGRPDRMFHFLLFAHWESPLVWDIFGITTYLAGSWLYLYFGLIPDFATCRDRLIPAVSGRRNGFFQMMALGWTGNAEQKRLLGMAIGLLTVVIVIVAVMMIAIASWIFSMTPREPWSNPLFGVYFVGGAAYSGIGIVAIMMAIFRQTYHLDDFITTKHFHRLGYLLATFAAVMLFFNISDFVMVGYKMSEGSVPYLDMMLRGSLANIFWVYIWVGLVLPIVIVLNPRTRTITGIVIASIAANVGMFIERIIIVVSGLRIPLQPYEPTNYVPTWIESSLTLAGIAVFVLVVVVLLKLFPPFSMWETTESMQQETESPASLPGGSSA
jgi:molybdopterin-containing oxidoreductase family membrane subunit